jgi:hypothetical protein
MDRIIWSFVGSTTVLSIGHHIDHALRHKMGWPLVHEVTPFTYALGFYVAIAIGAPLSTRGVVGPGFWAIVAMIGLAFLVPSHYGPIAEDPTSMFASAYGSQTKGMIALIWLWIFLLTLTIALVYCAYRWAVLRRQSLARPSAA